MTNEQDGAYYGNFHNNGGALNDPAKPDHVADLAAIYNACSVAMRAVDPTIKIGGPAVARPDWTDFETRFVAATAPNLDFYSYHAYASGSKDDSDTHIYDRADDFGAMTKAVAGILKTASPTKPIPAFFDEYNISWSWDIRDPRITSFKGTVFDALAITSGVTNGASATLAWNECDGIYGKMDNSYNLRPSAMLFHWLNTEMIGAVSPVISSESTSVVAYAVKKNNGQRSLLLINRSAHDRVANISSLVGVANERQFSDTGVSTLKANLSSLKLPAHSVTLLCDDEKSN